MCPNLTCHRCLILVHQTGMLMVLRTCDVKRPQIKFRAQFQQLQTIYSGTQNCLPWEDSHAQCPPLPAHTELGPTYMGMLQTPTCPLPPHHALRNTWAVEGNPFPGQGTPPAPASHDCTSYTRKLTSLHFKLGLLLGGSFLLQQKKYMGFFSKSVILKIYI